MTDQHVSPRTRSRAQRWARELLVVAAFLLALVAARSSLADHYRVPTGSMEPTVRPGDRVLVDKTAYGVRVPFTDLTIIPRASPERGDVVVLDSPEDGAVLLKRVVALPGDLVEVQGGALYLGGRPVPVEPLAGGLVEDLGRTHEVRLGGADFGPVAVPPDHYLVLGDNRPGSYDGRAFGFVERGAIFGRVIAVYYRDGFTWVRPFVDPPADTPARSPAR
jgi:signal peptidase I